MDIVGRMRICLFGATGFIGHHILGALVEAGHTVTAVLRSPASFPPHSDRVTVVPGDISLPQTYGARLAGHAASINAVGLLRPRRGLTYDRTVVRGTQAWVEACREAKVQHLILISALGADPEGTPYQTSKWKAEQAVRGSGRAWTIFRPSLVFGLGGENFTSRYAAMVRRRIVPIVGAGSEEFEPVAAWDLATALLKSLQEPRARNRVFSIGGPERWTTRRLLEEIRGALAVRAWFVRVPRWAALASARLFGWLPFFPATHEMVTMLLQGSVAPENDWVNVFGIEPTHFSAGLRRCLAAQR